MRYELADDEWTATPMLPNKPRGVPRVNDLRVLNGMFRVLRSGALWRDLPEIFGPSTTCYNRFVRWRRADVWGRIIDTLAAAQDAAVQMIDTSMSACINMEPASLGIGANRWEGHAAACRKTALSPEARVNAASDRGYDADWIRELAMKRARGPTSPEKPSQRSDLLQPVPLSRSQPGRTVFQ